MVSVLILTKNEEQDLPGCLESVSWCDDIHVLDSYSSDATVSIAEEKGVFITQRMFDGYASQRNAGLALDFKYNWIFILDADERIPIALHRIIIEGIKRAGDNVAGFRIRRRDFLGHSWLKYAQLSPFFIRLVKKGKVYYHREINEVIEADGLIEELDGYFDHYPFSKGYRHWLEKHNTYSTMEAERWVEEQRGCFYFSWRKALFAKDFTERRFHQKGLFYKMPCRPLIKWIYMVFVRKAFLDGKAGLTYAALQFAYEYFIVLKTREILSYKKSAEITTSESALMINRKKEEQSIVNR
ncbi:glycosyltransferase family 2 protein [Chitinophaga sp. 30R24]|uniref:glycosyltransferase family 2 protein n=1 Tax=Chitinophaga sp. 30R24 TaxID=3248838 RepID=UPI003B91F63E